MLSSFKQQAKQNDGTWNLDIVPEGCKFSGRSIDSIGLGEGEPIPTSDEQEFLDALSKAADGEQPCVLYFQEEDAEDDWSHPHRAVKVGMHVMLVAQPGTLGEVTELRCGVEEKMDEQNVWLHCEM